MSAILTQSLPQLRQQIAQIEASIARPALRLCAAGIDAALGGGLAGGALHELAPALPIHAGAAAGFALALAALTRGAVLWIETDFARAEAGAIHGPGLKLFGLALERLVVLTVPRALDVLWAMEEALRSGAVAIVIGTVDGRVLDDGSALRRLALASRESGVGLILRPHPSPAASTAATRWEIAAAPSAQDQFGGLGRTTFALSLTKNRRGPCGRWLLAWDHHECIFLPALSVGMAETARDRPDHAPLARTG